MRYFLMLVLLGGALTAIGCEANVDADDDDAKLKIDVDD